MISHTFISHPSHDIYFSCNHESPKADASTSSQQSVPTMKDTMVEAKPKPGMSCTTVEPAGVMLLSISRIELCLHDSVFSADLPLGRSRPASPPAEIPKWILKDALHLRALQHNI